MGKNIKGKEIEICDGKKRCLLYTVRFVLCPRVTLAWTPKGRRCVVIRRVQKRKPCEHYFISSLVRRLIFGSRAYKHLIIFCPILGCAIHRGHRVQKGGTGSKR